MGLRTWIRRQRNPGLPREMREAMDVPPDVMDARLDMAQEYLLLERYAQSSAEEIRAAKGKNATSIPELQEAEEREDSLLEELAKAKEEGREPGPPWKFGSDYR